VSWFGRLFRRASDRPPKLPEKVRTLDDVKLGERAQVVCLCRSPSRSSALAVFGIVPGAEVTVIQQRPACVVRIGETELALDRDIAEQVLVGVPTDEVPAA
jgi:Fe2+ transport system protein FeoA